MLLLALVGLLTVTPRRPGAAIGLLAALAVGPACQGPEDGSDVAVIEAPSGLLESSLAGEVARRFLASHGDDFDLLVIWPSYGFLSVGSRYFPMANDVAGIGYAHSQLWPELFRREDVPAERLAGVVGMATGWEDAAGTEDLLTESIWGGHFSILGALAQEVGHRWAARVHYLDSSGEPSLGLLGSAAAHWSHLLDTGGSPLGGCAWEPVGPGEFFAGPPTTLVYSALDLYLMGALAADEVPPLTLLHPPDEVQCGQLRPNGEVVDAIPGAAPCPTQPPPTTATAIEGATTEVIGIEQIIAAEGPRSPAFTGLPPSHREAWILLVPEGATADPAELETIDRLRLLWADYFAQASGGKALVDTALSMP